jgi:hypothetical protein
MSFRRPQKPEMQSKPDGKIPIAKVALPIDGAWKIQLEQERGYPFCKPLIGGSNPSLGTRT